MKRFRATYKAGEYRHAPTISEIVEVEAMVKDPATTAMELAKAKHPTWDLIGVHEIR